MLSLNIYVIKRFSLQEKNMHVFLYGESKKYVSRKQNFRRTIPLSKVNLAVNLGCSPVFLMLVDISLKNMLSDVVK